MSTCEELDTLLSEPPGDEGRRTRLAAMEGVESCIAAELARTAAQEDWGRFERYVFAAFLHPDRSMTGVLCDVLSRQIETVNNEDIVETLEMIADPASVSCLEDAMLWEPDWDEFHWLARKCVWALSKIGTPEAIQVMRDAASVGPEEVREEAIEKLRYIGA